MIHLMTWGMWYWPRYLIAVAVFLLGPELYALATNHANTLSDYAWSQLHVGLAFGPASVHSIAWWASLIIWILTVIALSAHIWWRVSPI